MIWRTAASSNRPSPVLRSLSAWRNGYLGEAERAEVVRLPLAFKAMTAALKTAGGDISAFGARAMATLRQRGWKPDYTEVLRRADPHVPTGNEPLVVLGAAGLGNTRLIDNLEI